ncbi:hypothetical protein RclHR1_12380002 [Rhizophagus clarus]|uniref:Uncharacterized protein n=1 Tax=Rhizophagus clarus TaxID=94130 RepID=A0A2Z6QZZ8_9GLOM|nr:hypothetical protein RclHR1_12380002 [Rhizophagus clarus]GES76461.1 hypothetical protein RCL_jg26336.t1 [Rhizophagus clarus]
MDDSIIRFRIGYLLKNSLTKNDEIEHSGSTYSVYLDVVGAVISSPVNIDFQEAAMPFAKIDKGSRSCNLVKLIIVDHLKSNPDYRGQHATILTNDDEGENFYCTCNAAAEHHMSFCISSSE